jgi:hypothetical protein
MSAVVSTNYGPPHPFPQHRNHLVYRNLHIFVYKQKFLHFDGRYAQQLPLPIGGSRLLSQTKPLDITPRSGKEPRC